MRQAANLPKWAYRGMHYDSAGLSWAVRSLNPGIAEGLLCITFACTHVDIVDIMHTMTGYTKLFGSIVLSTIWREPNHIRIVWITMLALADKRGIVEGSVPGLADLCRVSVDECREGLEKLKAPDPDSRTKAEQGRRILEIEGGWQLVNHAKYRAKLNQDERREYLRVKKQESRVNKRRGLSTPSTQPEAAPEAEASTTTTHHDGRPGSLQAVLDRAAITGCPSAEAERFWHHYESSGWVDKNGNPVVNWQSKLAIWATDARARPLEQAHKGQPSQLSNVDKSIFSKEFDRVEARIKSIKDSYAEHQTCSKQDAERLSALRARRDELKKLLGMQV